MPTPRLLAYPAKFEKVNADEILVTFPDLPEALTSGATLEEAFAEAIDCLEEAIAGRIIDRDEIPIPSKRAQRDGYQTVHVPSQTAGKAALYLAMREAGVTKVELGRRLGVDEKEVRRMLDPRHGTRQETIDVALRTCGYAIESKLTLATPHRRLLSVPGGKPKPARLARQTSLARRRETG